MADNKAHILIVDDDPASRRVLRKWLERLWRHVTVTEAQDGKAAITLALSQRFGLIFLDLKMPEPDGFAILTTLRKMAQVGHHTPIIAYTASVIHPQRARCLEAGFDDFLGKPITHEDVWHIVSRWLDMMD